MTLIVSILFLCLLAGGSAAQESSADRVVSKALEHLREGRAHAREGLYPRALGELRIAVALAEQAPGAGLILALALHNLAEAYRLNGERGNALQAYRRALAIHDKLNHKPGIAIAQLQISALLKDSDPRAAPAGQTRDSLSSTAAPASERRLNRIDKAVERIRRRLGSSEARQDDTPGTSGSIELSKSGAVLRPDQIKYARAVKDKIQHGWKYPATARNRHQEGTVEIEFSVLSNGEIESIKILKSSGFLPLDMETIRSVREAAPFSANAPLGGQRQINLRMLFNYALPVPEANRFKEQATAAPSSDR